MNINWKVRFSRKNVTFLIRFIAALALPVLAYMGIRVEDLTTWPMIGRVIIDFVSNPFLVGLTIINGLNVIPDPIVKGFSDSPLGLSYTEPKDNGGKL